MKTKYNTLLIIIICAVCAIGGALAQTHFMKNEDSLLEKLRKEYQTSDIYIVSKDPLKRDENPYAVLMHNGDICIVNIATQEILIACKPNYADPIIRIFSNKFPILTVYVDKKKMEPMAIQLSGLTEQGWFSKRFSGTGELLDAIEGKTNLGNTKE
jgi:hypothetical protein